MAAAALAVRLAFQLGIDAYPKVELIRNRLDDQTLYDAWAKSILQGAPMDWAGSGHEFAYWASRWPGVFPQDPLYAYLLAGFYAAAGFAYDGWRLLQAALGAGTAVLVVGLARRHVRPAVALACGGLVALYRPLVFYEASFLREPLAAFLVALTLAAVSAAGQVTTRRRAWTWAAVTGLALGLAVLLRSHLALPAAAVGLWLLVATRRRFGIGPTAVLAVMLAIPVLPVVARNSLEAGRPAWISSSGPYNLFVGNVHDDATGGPWAESSRVKAQGPPESVDLMAALRAHIRAHPGAFLRRQVAKAVDLFGAREIPDNLSVGMGWKCVPALALALVTDGALLPIALLGAALGLGSWRRHALLYAVLLAYAASVIPFVVVSRLRLPMVPVLAVLAGLALDRAWGLLERRQGWRLAALATVAAVFVVAWRPGPQPLRPADFQMAAAAYDRRGQLEEAAGDLPAALRAYGRAVALNPDHGAALVAALRLRAVLPSAPVPPRAAELSEQARRAAAERRFPVALALLDEAAALAPDWWLPHQYATNVEVLRGRLADALPHLERAVALAPGNGRLRENLKALRRAAGVEG